MFLDLAQHIPENVTLSSYNRRGMLSHDGSLVRLQAKTLSHFPKHIPATACS
jgi:hypothetical protein